MMSGGMEGDMGFYVTVMVVCVAFRAHVFDFLVYCVSRSWIFLQG